MSFARARSRAILLALAATFLVLAAIVLAASWLAKAPYASDQVFGKLRTGQLWSGKARYVDDWYAVEAIDAGTFIIGEPKSSQYNSSYLLVGGERALLVDAGSGERPEGIRTMRALAESLTDKPVVLMLSHFHFDHTGDLDAFEGALVLATPELKAREEGGKLRMDATESLTGGRDLRIAGWVAPGATIDLGGRAIEARSTPGHAHESATLVDRARRYVFAGDFLYQHLGGLVAFLPGSDTQLYAEQIRKLLAETGDGYRFFGAHGQPEFDAAWVKRVLAAMHELASGAAQPALAASYLAPGLPLSMHQEGELLIYQPPLVAAPVFYSWRFLLAFVAVLGLVMALFWRLFRALELRKSGV